MATYEIIKRSKENFNGIQMGNKTGKFKNNIMRTKDASLARDIRQKFGQEGGSRDVLVARVPDGTYGNTYAMGVSFDEDGNIRREE